nr:immunoglobulin heavy chain junction region [Macaca mulatta]MOY21600.1 immunoglobulin heavy chain junction region [Macaca mulatta]MOY21972.1 immunoglobulin heavy chain junction region [Macaca mulatta]MOY22096.1 immunoglobulin heavy chain junction region [Macaca mulatta]MOY22510.1 immunoglobulin heavy chain junction region [Macaca mulatta]
CTRYGIATGRFDYW